MREFIDLCVSDAELLRKIKVQAMNGFCMRVLPSYPLTFLPRLLRIRKNDAVRTYSIKFHLRHDNQQDDEENKADIHPFHLAEIIALNIVDKSNYLL